MTTLMYRGTTHTNTDAALSGPRGPLDLIYRGQCHDGRAVRTLRPAGGMCYRGVRFAAAADVAAASQTPAQSFDAMALAA